MFIKDVKKTKQHNALQFDLFSNKDPELLKSWKLQNTFSWRNLLIRKLL